MDVYVLEWGTTGRYAHPMRWCLKHTGTHPGIWNDYKKGTMATLHLNKFANEIKKQYGVNDIGLENDSGLMNLTDPSTSTDLSKIRY